MKGRLLALAAVLLGAAAPASALVINGSYKTSGFIQGFRIDQGGSIFIDNNAAYGGGSLPAIFAAAAGYWERELLDDRTVNVQFGWTNDNQFGSSALAAATYGGVLVNTRVRNHFLDSTPEENEEFGTDEYAYADLGYGPMTVGHRVNRLDDRAVYDLLSTIIHELGHVLANLYFPGDGDDPLVVTDPRPFAGLEIPIYGGDQLRGHVDVPQNYVPGTPIPVMYPYVDGTSRSFISDIDLLAIAEAGGYEHLSRFEAAEVPEPAMLGLLGFGALVLFRRRAGRPAGHC